MEKVKGREYFLKALLSIAIEYLGNVVHNINEMSKSGAWWQWWVVHRPALYSGVTPLSYGGLAKPVYHHVERSHCPVMHILKSNHSDESFWTIDTSQLITGVKLLKKVAVDHPVAHYYPWFIFDLISSLIIQPQKSTVKRCYFPHLPCTSFIIASCD